MPDYGVRLCAFAHCPYFAHLRWPALAYAPGPRRATPRRRARKRSVAYADTSSVAAAPRRRAAEEGWSFSDSRFRRLKSITSIGMLGQK
eukprot:5197728-Pleurochrysis_carterae.AAC.2